MDGFVLLTSTPSCVVSPRGPRDRPARETTHSGVDVNNTHSSMINPLNYIWVINTFIAHKGASYLKGFTVYIYS